MLYSAAGEGMNDALPPEHALRVCLPGTTHLNFHDVAKLLPVLRLLGATGRADARETIVRRNALVRDFLAAVGGAGESTRGDFAA